MLGSVGASRAGCKLDFFTEFFPKLSQSVFPVQPINEQGETMNSQSSRTTRLLLASGCWLAILLLNSAAAAGPPYLTIGRHHPSHNVQRLHPQGYAYGWFGATSRPQAERQTGYYGLYRQWRIK